MDSLKGLWAPINSVSWALAWGFESKIHNKPVRIYGMMGRDWFIGLSKEIGVASIDDTRDDVDAE